MNRRLPASYVVALVTLAAIASLALLIHFGVPPFDSTEFFLNFLLTGYLGLIIVGIVGGAFVGMFLAHRALATRQFTPFERIVMENLADIRDRLARLEADREAAPPQPQGEPRLRP